MAIKVALCKLNETICAHFKQNKIMQTLIYTKLRVCQTATSFQHLFFLFFVNLACLFLCSHFLF